jgi:hypothetical protein
VAKHFEWKLPLFLLWKRTQEDWTSARFVGGSAPRFYEWIE